MKYIKNHIMFLFPMLAILIGIESFFVFGRMSRDYEQTLKSQYSMLVLANKPMTLKDFRAIDTHISRLDIIDKESIVQKMAKGMRGVSADEIIKDLPYFYTVHFDSYLDTESIERSKDKLLASKDIRKVENFGKSHNSSYNLFVFIKVILWTFVAFMTFTSLFLVIKQMEVWQLAHKEQMQVMEIFGASTMLRSGVLFKTAMIDALAATIITSLMFAFLRYVWVQKSGIATLIEKSNLLFQYSDILILGFISILIVIVAVVIVVLGNKESRL